jgi:hypothetical protein
MDILWAIQIAFDLLFLAAIGTWVWRRVGSPRSDSLAARLSAIESKESQRDFEWQRIREDAHAGLRTLHRICESAQKILDKSRESLWTPTLEETELRMLIDSTDSSRQKRSSIPSLNELEKTKDRLRTESLVNLQTLLREQLA